MGNNDRMKTHRQTKCNRNETKENISKEERYCIVYTDFKIILKEVEKLKIDHLTINRMCDLLTIYKFKKKKKYMQSTSPHKN